MKKWISVFGVAAALLWQSQAAAQILIGQTAGFTGPVAAGVKETTEGAKLYIENTNAKGGVNGQTIELVSLDDQFDPKKAAENARILIEDKQVVALFLTRGTPHTEAIIPLLDQHGTALVAPSTGAMVLHKPVRRHVFNVRATYQKEAEKAIVQLNAQGLSKIVVLHPDDSFGHDGATGAQNGFDAIKSTPLGVFKFDRAKPDFSSIAPKVAQLGAQAVIFIGSGSTVVSGTQALRSAGSGAQIVTLSNNASEGFIKSMGPHARGVIVTQVFPNERSVSYGMVKEAIEMAKKKGLDGVSPAMLEGYAGAKVLVEALRRAGSKPTRAKVVSALESIRKFDLGSLEISYSSEDHTGLDFSDLSIIGADGKFRR
jgi:branched-chain amino acid transport system substrate-binding protein